MTKKQKEINIQITLETMLMLLVGESLFSEIEGVRINIECPSVKALLKKKGHKDLLAFENLVDKIDKLLEKFR